MNEFVMDRYMNKWKNNELNKLLMEKFNIGGKKEYNLEEGVDRIFAPNHYCLLETTTFILKHNILMF